MKECPKCKMQFYDDANECPQCNEPLVPVKDAPPGYVERPVHAATSRPAITSSVLKVIGWVFLILCAIVGAASLPNIGTFAVIVIAGFFGLILFLFASAVLFHLENK